VNELDAERNRAWGGGEGGWGGSKVFDQVYRVWWVAAGYKKPAATA
jgi:hypothetical protein